MTVWDTSPAPTTTGSLTSMRRFVIRVSGPSCVTGGCGSFRLVRGVDVEALRADPKPIVGYSDITALHRVWQAVGVPSLHGAGAGAHAETVRKLLIGALPIRSSPIPTGTARC